MLLYLDFAELDISFPNSPTEITVAKVQVAAYCQNRGPNSLLGTMSRLADEADTDEVKRASV